MKNKNFPALAIATLAGLFLVNGERSNADVTIEIVADQLRYDVTPGAPEIWTAAPVSSMFLIVADFDDNGFTDPVAPGTFAEGGFLDGLGGDDYILHQGFLQGTGVIFDSFGFSLGGNLTAGTPLALYWFPTLNSLDLTAEVGNYYGSFTTGTSMAVPWVIPTNGNTVSLGFFTTAATDPPVDALPASAGNANQQVQAVPEPSTCLLLAFSGMALLGLRRRNSEKV